LVDGFFDGSEDALIRFLRESESESRAASNQAAANSIDTVLL
jgi:hypothetical protein